MRVGWPWWLAIVPKGVERKQPACTQPDEIVRGIRVQRGNVALSVCGTASQVIEVNLGARYVPPRRVADVDHNATLVCALLHAWVSVQSKDRA